jgi:hypothetical protein
MSPTLDAFLRSWPSDPWLAVALVVSGRVYLRDWLVLHRRDPRGWHGRSFVERPDDCRVSVVTSPNPLRTGSVDMGCFSLQAKIRQQPL